MFFFRVYSALANGMQFAIKIFSQDTTITREAQLSIKLSEYIVFLAFHFRVTLLFRTNCPYIVKTYCYAWVKPFVCLFQEFCNSKVWFPHNPLSYYVLLLQTLQEAYDKVSDPFPEVLVQYFMRLVCMSFIISYSVICI